MNIHHDTDYIGKKLTVAGTGSNEYDGNKCTPTFLAWVSANTSEVKKAHGSVSIFFTLKTRKTEKFTCTV